jgi:hypothetical protein
MRQASDASQGGPFGMADGASEDRKTFIRFQGQGDWADLSISESSLRERFFVGRRGSGKSRYLREQERSASKKMLVFRQRTDAIGISMLRQLHREFSDPAEREEIWVDLWHVATNLALGSFLLTSPDVDKGALSERDRHELMDIVSQSLGSVSAPFPIIAALNQILQSTNTQHHKLRERLGQPQWNVLEHLVGKLVSVSSPVAMFIDSLDENFREAPAENGQAQLGLLLYMARTLTDPSRTNRPHLFVTVRDVVYSQFLAHEQGERYVNETHWKVLDWRKGAARYFFEEKIRQLPPTLLLGPADDENMFRRWLGVERIYNPQRDVEEEVGDFLLRHTRFLPREVVEIGNAICSSIRHKSETPLDIWSLVVKQAEHIGERALEVIIDHVVALSDASFPSHQKRANYRKLIEEAVSAFRSGVTSEVFSRAELEEADRRFMQTCNDAELSVALSDLLWQHGLIGYMYNNEARASGHDVSVFYHAVGGVEGSSAYKLPRQERYRLHASLLSGGRVELDQSVPIIVTMDAVE